MTKNKIKKEDFSKDLSFKKGFSISYSNRVIENLIDVLKEKIIEGSLNLKNIGTFRLLEKKERKGRNPKTLENFIITKRKSLSFKASKKILNLLNK